MSLKILTLVVSSLISAAVLGVIYLGPYNVCAADRSCADFIATLSKLGIPFIALSVLSVSTLAASRNLLRPWAVFSLFFIPLSVFLILIAPDTTGNWMFPHDKGRVALISALAYFIISLGILAQSLLLSRRKAH